ncbi:MAG: GTP-binding protein, partial [Deltaproteobacteria bacterium]|nr:GTP-binding protein [Deltaproteobacteria bacterium]
PAAEHESPLAEVFEDQLACADLVIVNKRDAMDDADVARVAALVAAHARDGVPLVETRFARIDADVVLGRAAGAEDDLDSRPSHIDTAGDHDHDDFESFAVELAAVADPERFEQRLQATIAAHDVLRVKGFLEVPGKPRRLALQAVGPRVERYFDRAWEEGEARRSRLVVIGRTGLDRAAIAEALRG